MATFFRYARPMAAAAPLAFWTCPSQGTAHDNQRGSFHGRLRYERGQRIKFSTTTHAPVHCSAPVKAAGLQKQESAMYPSEETSLKFKTINDVMRWLNADLRLVHSLESVVGPLGNSIRKLSSLPHKVVFDGLCAALVDDRKLHPTETQDLAMAWSICRRVAWVREGNVWNEFTHVNVAENPTSIQHTTASALVPSNVCGAADVDRGSGPVVDGYMVHPEPTPALKNQFQPTALSMVGGSMPVGVHEFARRAYLYALDPLRNPVKEAMDAFPSVRDLPPMLGIFNDIPADKMREDEVMSWAKAGFRVIINDGEHAQLKCWMGKPENAMLGRAGLLSVQRLHREALSEHGDAFQLGARATMRPYGTTLAESEQYYEAVSLPAGRPGTATMNSRGGYPVRLGDRELVFTPNGLRAAETEVQGWLQFETSEYILDAQLRDQVLDLMHRQGVNKAVAFVGPFDAIVRDGPSPGMDQGINDLFKAAADRGIACGRVCGSGTICDPHAIEELMVNAINAGCRFIMVHYMTSDLPYKGADAVATPFWNACKRCGF